MGLFEWNIQFYESVNEKVIDSQIFLYLFHVSGHLIISFFNGQLKYFVGKGGNPSPLPSLLFYSEEIGGW